MKNLIFIKTVKLKKKILFDIIFLISSHFVFFIVFVDIINQSERTYVHNYIIL